MNGRSGGHGNLPASFAYLLVITWFAAQLAGCQRLTDSRLAQVDAGCNRVSSTEISTNLVRLPLSPLADAIGTIPRPLRRRTAGRKRLRICIYARYSTEEQDESSIADQFAYCERYLETIGIDLKAVIIDRFSDAEMSGETVSRPGVDQVREGVREHRWDILICEDVSRLFRNLSACCDVVETAFDNGIRFIAINDDVDTSKDDWEDRFYDAAQHHAKSNRYTAHRIKRKLESLWRMGAAIGLLKTGYRRSSQDEDTEMNNGRRQRKKPKYDEIDPEWEKVICEAFGKIAAGHEPDDVAEWLTEKGLPKASNAKTKKWFRRNVISMIRNSVYQGLEIYRFTTTERKLRSGSRRQKRSQPEQVLTREMPHLRIVEPWLWEKANKKLDDRMVKKLSVSGDAHPMTGLPRDSRFPLSGLFFCGACGGKMYATGRNEGGYRCKHATLGGCWNKTTALRDFVHQQISSVVVDQLLTLDGVLDALVAHIQSGTRDDELRRSEERRLHSDIRKLERECSKLGEIIINEARDAPTTLISKLKERERLLEQANAELQNVKFNLASPPNVSATQIRERITEFSGRLFDLDKKTGRLLARLIDGQIHAIPHLQLDSTVVVLRAEFVFRPMGILPDDFAAALTGSALNSVAEVLPARRIMVDLFKPSIAPTFAMAAFIQKKLNPKMTLQKIGDHLGISKRSAHVALQFGKKMQTGGIKDPFVRLEERPENVARWT